MALFGWKSEKRPEKKDLLYEITDCSARPLARGLRVEAPGHRNLYVKLLSGNARSLREAGILQAIPRDSALPPMIARLIGAQGDAVSLEPIREGGAVRLNFRVPVAFDSFLYPPGGGRGALRSIDFSCGGLAFRTPRPMRPGERFELVIPPVSEGPLLVWAELLRSRDDPGEPPAYACKFLDLIDEEEHLLREAVFAIQVDTARRKPKSAAL